MLIENWFLHSLSSIAGMVQAIVPTAYIDPASGGMLFQLLAVLFALFSGFILFFSRNIKSGLARVKRFMNEKFNRQ